MKLITELNLPEYPFQLDHNKGIVMMGSCFTDNIGAILDRLLFRVLVNPFGVTYNPLSIIAQVESLLAGKKLTPGDLRKHDGKWFSFLHSTKFSSPDQKQALDLINTYLQAGNIALKKAEFLVLTWGSAWAFHHQEDGRVVSNCHKIPAAEFERKKLSTKEIISAYERFLPSLFERNPNLKIIYTISPVRHWKDGAHGNQLSKASLLLAGDALQDSYPDRFFYFPSYELVMDELRDYRYYTDDMLHISEQASRYIWDKFASVLVSPSSHQVIESIEPLLKLIEHRSIGRDKTDVTKQQEKINNLLNNLKTKYPSVNWSKFV